MNFRLNLDSWTCNNCKYSLDLTVRNIGSHNMRNLAMKFYKWGMEQSREVESSGNAHKEETAWCRIILLIHSTLHSSRHSTWNAWHYVPFFPSSVLCLLWSFSLWFLTLGATPQLTRHFGGQTKDFSSWTISWNSPRVFCVSWILLFTFFQWKTRLWLLFQPLLWLPLIVWGIGMP